MRRDVLESAPATLSPEKAISHGITAIYKEYLGKGADRAQTLISNRMAVTTLNDSMTKAELTLVDEGEAETVREMRRKFQFAMRTDITTLVEGITGREGGCFLSDHDTVHDIAVEMVVFKPE